MQYTPSEFRRVEHEFLQEFELKTQEFYDQNVNSNNIIEYKKIINQIKTRRNQAIEKKQKCEWLHKRGKTIDVSAVHDRTQNIVSSRQKTQQEKPIEEEQTVGFYLTENVWKQSKNKQKTQMLQESRQKSVSKPRDHSRLLESQNSRALLLKSRAQMMALEHPENQNLNLENLYDRIYGQYSVLECLEHEESQVQEAIFCFKKRIMAMEEQLNQEDIKSKEVDRLLIENNNQMLRAKHTNQRVKSSFLKTKKHFDLDLDGRKQIQVRFGQKNKQEFQESIVNHIYLKKMKHHIAEQEKQLHKLNSYRHELEKKENKYKSIYLKEQELSKTYEEIKAINNREMNKKPIVSILDKEFDEFDSLSVERSKSRRVTKTVMKQENEEIQKQSSKKLSQLVREIVELYRKMKHQESSKISQFKQLINVRDEKEADYMRVVSKMPEVYQELFQERKITNPQDNERIQSLKAQIAKISSKKKFLSLSSNGIESRLKFYLSKQLAIIKKIISTWMKSDKLASKYIDSIYAKLYEISASHLTVKGNLSSNSSSSKPILLPVQEKQLSVDDSRNLLVGCFENWQEYLWVLDIIHRTPFIYRFITKQRLFKLFKRIIKTKVNNKLIPTEDIFEKGLELSFDEGRATQTNRIEKLLNIFRDIFVYLKKVETGTIRLNCAINYDLPIQIRQTESNQQSRAPSRNEIERFSTKKELTIMNDRCSLGIKHESSINAKQSFGSFSDSRKFLKSTDNRDDDIISKLKKIKQIKPVFNIHEFYEDLREQIEKVNKISTY